MPNRPLIACLDANILVSAAAFGGIPGKIVERLGARDFSNLISPIILDETRRALSSKLLLNAAIIERFFHRVMEVSKLVHPTGILSATPHPPDNLVLETALLGGADILVTGDKKHLLPLRTFRGVIIEPPSAFLKRLR